jgi:PAS domain S-box-containing protein
MDTERQVLYVDDDPAERAAVAVERAHDVVVVRRGDPAEALAYVADHPRAVDCIVSGFRLPGRDGLDFFGAVRRRLPDPPPFVLVADDADDVLSEALAAGVTDYVRREACVDGPELLVARVGNALELAAARRGQATPGLRTVVDRIARRLVGATDRDGIDRRVCETLAAAWRDGIAWLGTVDDEADALAPRRVAGVDADALDDRPAERAVARTALDEDRVVVRPPASVAERDAGRESSGRSVAAVPVDDGEATRGVICVSAARRDAFDVDDRTALAELGRTVARAYDRVDLRRAFERQHRQLFAKAPVMFALTAEVDGRPVVEDCNRHFAETLGYSREELRGTELEALYTDASEAILLDDGYDRARTGDFVRERRTLVGRDGETVRTLLRATPRRDPDGEVIGTLALYVDITDRAQVGRLEALRGRMEFALDITDSHVYEIDLETGEQTRYGAFERIFGVESEAAPTTDDFYERCVHPDDREQFVRIEREGLDSTRERPVEVTYRTHPDHGPVRWVESTAYVKRTPDDSGSARTLVGLATDVTDRRRRQEELRDAKATLERRTETVERFLEAVVDRTTSFETKVERVLDLGRSYLDVETGIVAAIDGSDYAIDHAVSPHDGVEQGAEFDLADTYCSLVVGADEPVGFHRPTDDAERHPAYRRHGLEAYLGAPVYVDGDRYGTLNFSSTDARSRPFSDEEYTFVRLFAQWLGSELGRRRSAARAAAHRERIEAQNERLDDFASVVSHDLRSPLNLARGRLELAREERDGEHLAGIDRGLSRIESLTDDLLRLARQGKRVDEPTAVDFRSVVEDCWGTLQSDRASLRIETRRTVMADRSRLRQLVENLLRNAVDHGGPDVAVTVGDVESGFYVADDGPGVPPEERDDVFTSGYSTRQEGTGLGLSIVREIATAHGWTVDVVESARGGARFEVTGIDLVDDADDEGTPSSRPSAPDDPSGGTGR